MTFSKNRLNLITAHHINDHLHSINWLHNYRSMSRSGRWEGRGQEWGHDQGGKCGQLNHTSIIVGNFRSNPNPYTGGGRSRQSVKPSKPGGARQLANAQRQDSRRQSQAQGHHRPQAAAAKPWRKRKENAHSTVSPGPVITDTKPRASDLPTLSTRRHRGPPLAPTVISIALLPYHVPLPTALHRGGVPDADAGQRNYYYRPHTPHPSAPALLLARQSHLPAPAPRSLRLRPAASLRLLLCSAPPPQGSNTRASPSPLSFLPRYQLAPALFIPPARRQRRSLCRGRVELVRSARRTPICATSSETARRHCSHGSCRGAGVRCSLALPGYTHTGFKLGMDWAAPPEVLHAPDRSGIPQTLYGNWQWQGYWGG